MSSSSSPWLIVGLGNPEKKYNHTRHNVGFRVLQSQSLLFKEDSHYHALVAKTETALYCLPLTYMNASGEAVQPLADYYHIPPDHIVVIYDDKEIPFGTIRLRSSGSDGGHNGMKSIINRLGTQSFPRVRIGVGPTPERWDAADFVLAPFTTTEEQLLPQILTAAYDAALRIVRDGITKQSHADIHIDQDSSVK